MLFGLKDQRLFENFRFLQLAVLKIEMADSYFVISLSFRRILFSLLCLADLKVINAFFIFVYSKRGEFVREAVMCAFKSHYCVFCNFLQISGLLMNIFVSYYLRESDFEAWNFSIIFFLLQSLNGVYLIADLNKLIVIVSVLVLLFRRIKFEEFDYRMKVFWQLEKYSIPEVIFNGFERFNLIDLEFVDFFLKLLNAFMFSKSWHLLVFGIFIFICLLREIFA